MAGLALLISTICLNATCINEKNVINYEIKSPVIDVEVSRQLKAQQIKEIENQLNGQTLSVTTLQDYPLSYTVKENGNLVGKGVAFEFLDLLMKKFNFTYTLKMPRKNIIGSTTDMEGSILELVKNEEVELVVAFLPVLSDARQYMRYSTSLDEGEYIMIMNRPGESASGSGLLAPFDETVWYLILVSLLCVGPLIYVLLVIRYKLTRDKEQIVYSLPHCVWFVYGALMKQGSVLSPTADSTRIIFASWWIFITILTSFYTANLTAFLTLSKFSLSINTAKDVLVKEKRFVAQRGFGVEYAIKNPDEQLNFLQYLVTKKIADFTTVENDTEIMKTLVEKKNMVYVRDKPAVDHIMYEEYKKRKFFPKGQEKAQCPFVVSYVPFLKRKRAFAYSFNSTLDKLMDPQLLHLVEAGIVKYKQKNGLPRAEICPQNLGSTERQLKLNDLFTTYMVMITGFSLGFVIFITEVIFRFLNKLKGKKNPGANGNKQVRKINVKPLESLKGTLNPKLLESINKKAEVSPPPPYGSIFSINRYGNNDNVVTFKKENENRRVINGRNYIVTKDSTGSTQLVPVRQPSATLFAYTYNNYS